MSPRAKKLEPLTGSGTTGRRRKADWDCPPTRLIEEAARTDATARTGQRIGRYCAPLASAASFDNSSFVHGLGRPAVVFRTAATTAGSTAVPVWPHSRRTYVRTAAI